MLKSKCKQLGSRCGHHIKGRLEHATGGDRLLTMTGEMSDQSAAGDLIPDSGLEACPVPVIFQSFLTEQKSCMSDLRLKQGMQEGLW